MTNDSALKALDAERVRLSLLTRKGIGMPAAGMLYWIAVAVVLQRPPSTSALVLCFILTGPVFPIGVGLTRLAGGDLLAKSPSLTPLGMQLAALQLFYWPIIIVVFRQAPEWTPFTLAVLFGSHFLPYGWLYQSRAYMFLTISVTVVLSAAVLITGDPLYSTIPILTAACYAVAVILLWREVAALREQAA